MRLGLLITVCALACSLPFLCSAQAPFAIIQGQVRDPSGAAVSGATVTALSTTGVAGTSATDREGRYRIGGLTPGPYTVRMVSRGFAPFESAVIDVPAGQSATLNFQLQIQSLSEKVTVSDTASQLGVVPLRARASFY